MVSFDSDLLETRKRSLLTIFFTLGLVVNLLLTSLWVKLQIVELIVSGIIVLCLFGFNFYLLKQKKFLLSLQIAIFAVIASSIAAHYLIGWEAYFNVYIIVNAIIIINSFALTLFWKVIETLVIVTIFIMSLLISRDITPAYHLDSDFLNQIALFNVVVVILGTIYLEFKNFIENDKIRSDFEKISDIDALTGVYNRRFFNKYLDIEINRLESHVQSKTDMEVNFGIAMIDIDDFKKINDQYGHLIGDAVLVEVTNRIHDAIFKRDILCRYGGEEFVVLFTSTSKQDTVVAVERILKSIESNKFSINTDKIHINIPMTVSIGFSSFDEDNNVFSLLELADKRLYAAKEAGKNRVVLD